MPNPPPRGGWVLLLLLLLLLLPPVRPKTCCDVCPPPRGYNLTRNENDDNDDDEEEEEEPWGSFVVSSGITLTVMVSLETYSPERSCRSRVYEGKESVVVNDAKVFVVGLFLVVEESL